MKLAFTFATRWSKVRVDQDQVAASFYRSAYAQRNASSLKKDSATSTKSEGIIEDTKTSTHQMKFYKDGKIVESKCGDDEEKIVGKEDEMENMFVEGPMGIEWNGPTRGGRRPEPTRYGDWERKGRASDF